MTCSAKMCPSSCELLLRFVKDNVVARWAKIGCGFKVDTFLPLPEGVSRSYFFLSPLSHFLQEVCRCLVKSAAFIKPVQAFRNLYSKLLYSIPIKWNILEHVFGLVGIPERFSLLWTQLASNIWLLWGWEKREQRNKIVCVISDR